MSVSWVRSQWGQQGHGVRELTQKGYEMPAWGHRLKKARQGHGISKVSK